MTAASDVETRAELLLELGRPEEAITLVQQALATEPDHAGLLDVLAQAQLELDPSAALQTAERLLALTPGAYRGNYLAAIACVHLNRAKPAVKHATEAVAVAPNHPGCHSMLAEALSRQGKYKLARAAAERALELDPLGIHGLLARGNVELNVGRWKASEHWYRQALEVDPHCRPARFNIAVAQEASGRVATALLTTDGLLRFDPTDRDARTQLDDVIYTTLVHVQWLASLLAFGALMIKAS